MGPVPASRWLAAAPAAWGLRPPCLQVCCLHLCLCGVDDACLANGSLHLSSVTPSGTVARLHVPQPSTSAPHTLPLQEFRQEEFVNGSALRLECNCRGDLALRHRECVMKWVQVRTQLRLELLWSFYLPLEVVRQEQRLAWTAAEGACCGSDLNNGSSAWPAAAEGCVLRQRSKQRKQRLPCSRRGVPAAAACKGRAGSLLRQQTARLFAHPPSPAAHPPPPPPGQGQQRVRAVQGGDPQHPRPAAPPLGGRPAAAGRGLLCG